VAIVGPAEVLPGPWHVNEEALRELEAFFASELEACIARHELEREAWIGNEMASRQSQNSEQAQELIHLQRIFDKSHPLKAQLRLSVESADGVKAEALSLAELRQDVLAGSIVPIKFTASLRTKYVQRGAISLNTSLTGEVQIDTETGFEHLRHCLRDWAIRHQASQPARMWHEIGRHSVHWILGGIVLVILISSTFPMIEVDKARAKDLLVNGITQEEVPEVLELVLRLQAGLGQKVRDAPNYSFLVAAGLVLLLLLTLSRYPTTIIGIGGLGVKALDREKAKVKAGTVTIPVFVLGTVLWPLLWDKVQLLFP
jgi:hypothetical protein